MPTYVHTDADGHETERVTTDPGSLADREYGEKTTRDDSGWSAATDQVAEDDPAPSAGTPDQVAEGTPLPDQAPPGKPPKGPRAGSKSADEGSGEG